MNDEVLGKTGLKISRIGLGGGQVGDGALSEADAELLLRGTLDSGVTIIDTARGYGLSEERIGRYLAPFADQYTLITKVGYGIEGTPDWTYDAVQRGIEEALSTMQRETIDVASQTMQCIERHFTHQ